MKGRMLAVLCVLLGTLTAHAWIDYSDNVPEQEPTFGKEFAGFALKIYTEKVEFEQEEAVKVFVEIKNGNPRTTLMPEEQAGEDRRFALYVVLGDKNGNSQFSRNLLDSLPDNFIAEGRIPPNAGTVLARVPFDTMRVSKVEEYRDGLPYFGPKKSGNLAGRLSPQLFTLKAVLLSVEGEKRPDFVVASELWRILLRPKSVDRMTAAEKQSKMKQYLAKMSEGAYGGIGVSSQLAAFGDEAVDDLIKMAERKGEGAVRESRIWAIVTLCNTGSERAEAYVLEKLKNPVDFGDLAFLAWHSQGFHSDRVTSVLSTFCEDAATGRPMPWEKTHGPESRAHGRGCLEFGFKHFINIRHSISDETAAGVVRMGDPKIASFGLSAWRPTDPDVTVRVVKPLFTKPAVHGNLKKATLTVLSQGLITEGFPEYDRESGVNEQWLRAMLWFGRKEILTAEQLAEALRWLVLDVRKENVALQEQLISALRSQLEGRSPVPDGRIVLPDHWVATWRWALHAGPLEKDWAVKFLCNQMRTREAIPDVVRKGLLLELRQYLGKDFPLKARTEKEIDLETDWPTCGQWLVDNGYFGKKGKR